MYSIFPSPILDTLKGNDVEIVWVDKELFVVASNSVETHYYKHDYDLIRFKGRKKDETPRKLYMESRKVEEIQDQVVKSIAMVSYSLIKGLILEENS